LFATVSSFSSWSAKNLWGLIHYLHPRNLSKVVTAPLTIPLPTSPTHLILLTAIQKAMLSSWLLPSSSWAQNLPNRPHRSPLSPKSHQWKVQPRLSFSWGLYLYSGTPLVVFSLIPF
jgi:hypothetical protein